MTAVMSRLFNLVMLVAVVLLMPGSSALARSSQCFAYVENSPDVVPAAFSEVATAGTVEIDYVHHSTFRLRSPAGAVIATDYAGFARTGPSPTVATMNHAHETHYTDFPDPAIKHILRGWNPQGGPAEHSLTIADVHIRNVPTDIRTWAGTVEADGNSIFIFEVADLCIGHLGHLHHKPTPDQLAEIGRLDVVFAPVDGSYTLDLLSMIEVLKELRASLVIPMHFFGAESLKLFLAGMSDEFDIAFAEGSGVTVSLENLPRRATVLVLTGF